MITNPPFSLFREYVAQLMKYEKKFLIIGPKMAAGNKDIFPLVKNNKIWWGKTSANNFKLPNGEISKIQNGITRWFTNLEYKKRCEDKILSKEYNETDYLKYDNYDAINVKSVNLIPKDYDGIIGVPITFLDKWNPKQFKIISFRKGDDNKDLKILGHPTAQRILIKKIKK